MSFTIKVGPLAIAWRPVPHNPVVCGAVGDWLLERALSAEIAFEAERMAHAHLIRCPDKRCRIYQVLVDQAVTAASHLLDAEMEPTRG